MDDFLFSYKHSLMELILHLIGLDESVKIVESLGGWCRGQIVDISRRQEVYKAAEEIKSKYGNVSEIYQCQCLFV